MNSELNNVNDSLVAVTAKKSDKTSNIIKGIFSYLFYQNFIIVVAVLCGLLIPSIDLENYQTLVAIDVVSSGIVAIVLMILYQNLIISDKQKIKELGKQGLGRFFDLLISGFFLFMAVKLAAGFLESTVFELLGLEYETSENQSLIELLTGSAPLLMTVSACIMAPICEELIFRGMVGEIIKDKRVYITVSGLIFGLVHVTGSVVLIFEIIALGLIIDYALSQKDKSKILLPVIMAVVLLIICGIIYYFQYGDLLVKITSLDPTEVVGSITYIIMGLYLAYIYAKHNSILLNMGIHSLNNIFSMVIILFFM